MAPVKEALRQECGVVCSVDREVYGSTGLVPGSFVMSRQASMQITVETVEPDLAHVTTYRLYYQYR